MKSKFQLTYCESAEVMGGGGGDRTREKTGLHSSIFKDLHDTLTRSNNVFQITFTELERVDGF